ncbi:hypothetical protein ACC685_36810, partial [Rhizobium ruizarguesonis]
AIIATFSIQNVSCLASAGIETSAPIKPINAGITILRAALFLEAMGLVGLMGALVSIPADAKQETFWIEKVAIIAVGQGVCGMPLADGDAM